MKVIKDKSAKPVANWSALKARLANLDPATLIGLLHDLYAASKDNQAFLHARFDLGDDILKPYKATIERWLSPDVFRGQDVSVSQAKKAVAEFKKGDGQPVGLAELMVFYCERAAGFSADVGMDDEVYLSALIGMFGQALRVITGLPVKLHEGMFNRLGNVRRIGRDLGYGVGEGLDALWSDHGFA